MSQFDSFVIKYRWIFVCLFLLPLTFLFETYNSLRNWFAFKFLSSPKKHADRVANIQRQIVDWIADGRRQLLCTSRPGWTAMSLRIGRYKKSHRNINIVHLKNVLEIDERQRIARVEPMVTMGQLSRTLTPLGWTIPVVPELDDLTVGGLIMGCGVESSSHVYGLFHSTCTAYELVLADGSLIRATESENSDLFYSVPWSHGTLGFLVSAEIKIIPAKRYVKLHYEPVYTQEDMTKLFEKESRDTTKNEFVEALVFSRTEAVVMTGTMTDEPGKTKINAIGKFWKPWFYTHVQHFLKSGPGEECITLRDYYHRHTRSIFWELQHIISFGNHPLFRYTLGWTMPPKLAFLKAFQTKKIKELYERHHVTQDILVPIETLADSIDVFHEEFNIYPLWACPMALPCPRGMVHAPRSEDNLYVDLGCYGVPGSEKFHFRDSLRKVEAFVRKIKGFQMLYADSFLTRGEFYEMFDHALYNKVRSEFQCENAFPVIYDKVSRHARTH